MLKLNKIYLGDCEEIIDKVEDKSINCIITSPPYWNLRDYGIEKQLGQEDNFEEYINKLCNIFDKCKRILRDDGTLWVNIGDSYFSKSYSDRNGLSTGTTRTVPDEQRITNRKRSFDYQPKCLCDIPFRFSIEMIRRGWIKRNTIIWKKSNSMPDSVKDRFTVDFEYVFLFSKKIKYYFEQQKEDCQDTYNGKRGNSLTRKKLQSSMRTKSEKTHYDKRNKRCVWNINTKGFKGAHFAVFPDKLIEPMILAGCPENGVVYDPFMGSGTTAVVCKKLNRNFIGSELNKDYIEIVNKRIKESNMVSYKRAEKFFGFLCKTQMDCKTRSNQDGVKGYKHKPTKKNPKEIEINLLGIIGDLLCIRHSRYGLLYICIPDEEWFELNGI